MAAKGKYFIGVIAVFMFVFLAVEILSAALEDTVILVVKPSDIWLPGPVTDFVSGPGTMVEGRIILNWTAPHEDNFSGGGVSGYLIRYATFSADSLSGDTAAWWNSAQNEIEILSPGNPGEEECCFVNILPSLGFGVTYYFAVKSYDDAALSSLIDVNADTPGQQASAFLHSPTPAVTQSDVRLPLPVTDLVAARDDIPRKPVGLTVLETTARYVKLSWTDSSQSAKTIDFDKYLIYRSTTGEDTVYSIIGSRQNSAFTDTSVIPDTQYYYRISIIDKPPVLESPLSEAVTTYVPSYTASLTEYSVEGYIRNSDGTGISSVKVSLSGRISDIYFTDLNGFYKFLNLYEGIYTITPGKTGWSFTPAEIECAGPNIVNQNFIGYYTEEEPKEIDISIGENDIPVRVSLPEPGKLKIVMPEKAKARRGVINPGKGDEVSIIFKSEKKPEEYVDKKFTIRIFNLLGELVEEIEKVPLTPDDTWEKWTPPDDLASGVYIIHVKGPGVNFHKKIPVLR